MIRHMTIEQLPYGESAQSWLKDRYGETDADKIWKQTQENYRNYLLIFRTTAEVKKGTVRAGQIYQVNSRIEKCIRTSQPPYIGLSCLLGKYPRKCED